MSDRRGAFFAPHYRCAPISIRKQCPLFFGAAQPRSGPIKQSARVFVYFRRLTRSRRSASDRTGDGSGDYRSLPKGVWDGPGRARPTATIGSYCRHSVGRLTTDASDGSQLVGPCSGHRDRTDSNALLNDTNWEPALVLGMSRHGEVSGRERWATAGRSAVMHLLHGGNGITPHQRSYFTSSPVNTGMGNTGIRSRVYYLGV